MLHVPWEKGDFSTLWRLCIESPSQPKLASSLHNKRLSYWRLTGYGRNDGGRGLAFLKSAPPKGETTHYILRVASAPSPTAVTDSLDFQVADAPLQIQFA